LTATSERLGKPSVIARVFDVKRNLSVVMVTVGIPSFSISTASWTRHEVQEPQSHVELMAKSGFNVETARASSAERGRLYVLIKLGDTSQSLISLPM